VRHFLERDARKDRCKGHDPGSSLEHGGREEERDSRGQHGAQQGEAPPPLHHCEPRSKWPLHLATSACLGLASSPVLILQASPCSPRRSSTDQSPAGPAQRPYLRWSPRLWVAPPVFPACVTSDTLAAFSGGGPAALGAAPLPNLDPFKYDCTTAGGQNRQEVRTRG
jgi:hypothetical protein